MNVNAMSRTRPGYDEGGREIGGSLAARPSMTIMAALHTVSEVQQSLSDVADEADRIAAQIAGPVPSSVGTTGEKRIADSIAESLNERAEALQDPVHRIRGALARISRSIGA